VIFLPFATPLRFGGRRFRGLRTADIRVPVKTLSDCLEAGDTMDDSPPVKRDEVIVFLEEARAPLDECD
jgi:hypothetical protein